MKNTFDTREDVKVEVDEDQGFFREDGNLDGIPDKEQGHGPVPPDRLPRSKMSKLKIACLLSVPIWIYATFFMDVGLKTINDVEFPNLSQSEIFAEVPDIDISQSEIEWLKSVSQLPEVQSAVETVEKGEEEAVSHYIRYTDLPVANRPDQPFENVFYMAYENGDGGTSWVVKAEYTLDGSNGSHERWDINLDNKGEVHKNMEIYDKWDRPTTSYSYDGYSLYKHTYKYKKGLINLLLPHDDDV